MTALLRAAALLANRAVTALLMVWDYLIKAVTALMKDTLSKSVVLYSMMSINLTER